MEEKRKHGFTLIEILVIVAIIALILSIVIPIFHHGPCGPKSLICASTIRQLGVGFHLYYEVNELWPAEINWCDSLKPYFEKNNEKVYLCFADKTGPCSYAMNENIPADAKDLPSDLVLLFESAPGWNQVGGADDVVTDRHGEKNPGANIAFADGHVEFVKPEDIPTLHWAIESQ